MIITQPILDELFKIYERLNYYSELHSEQLRTVQDQFSQRLISIKRDGMIKKVKEKALWDEIRYLGLKSEAGETMKAKYPDVFDSHEKHQKAVEEARAFVMRNMGFNFTQMTLSDYIKLTLALIEYDRNKNRTESKPVEAAGS